VTEPGAALSAREIGDDLLIHDPEGRRVCFLNRTARQVWEMAGAGASIDRIVQAVCAAHPDVHEPSVRADVEACLDELGRLGLRAG